MTRAKRAPMTFSEAGRKGGAKVAQERGREYLRQLGMKGGMATKAKGAAHFREIGAMGGLAVREERGPEYFQRIGAKGGRAVASRHGVEHYQRIGRQGAEAARRKAAEAKAGASAGLLHPGSTSAPACGWCGLAEEALSAAGRGLYTCDKCGRQCCSDHSENGQDTTVVCSACSGAASAG